MPWIHQFIQPTGVKYCCASTRELTVAPTEFANSDYLAQVKHTIKQGQVPEDCRRCVEKENMGFVNTRQLALADWNYTVDTVPDRVEYLDLRYSNQCNFSCRTCEPAYSSQISKELDNNPALLTYYKKPAPRIHQDMVASIDPFLHNLTKINFTGGEPLIIKENFDLLENLIAAGRTDVQLLITTNASTTNPRMLDLFRQFTDIHFTVSIDAVGPVAEYVRHGTDWNRVASNVAELVSLNHSITINCTVSSYSILDLARLVTYFVQLKNQCRAPLEIMFSVVQDPTFLYPGALPKHLKNKAIEQLTASVAMLQAIESNPAKHLQTLIQLKSELESADVHGKTHTFVVFTNTLDGIRNQNFTSTFGEPL